MKKSDLKKQKLNSKNVHSQNEQDEKEVKQEYEEAKDQVKLEHEDGPKRWFEDQNLVLDEDQKWQYLQHHGVTFPKVFIPKNLKLKHKGENIQVTPFEEQLATFWVQSLGTPYQTHQFYPKNFSEMFMQRLKKEKPHIKFQELDFTQFIKEKQRMKQEKQRNKESIKAQQKKQKQAEAKYYGIARVDGIIQKLSGFQIEPPTLFKGRGAHPKAGTLKPRIMPEQVTINVAQDAPIPICNVHGHSWAQIVCKRDATWLCSYKNDLVNAGSGGKSHKYVFLAPNSKFKGMKDRQKYEKARRLKNTIETIRQNYLKMINDKDIRNKQLGTTTYIIDKLALRVGNEKGDDQADTVGCCSLRIEHVKLLPENKIQFDFLGKDSMRYHNVVTIIPEAWRNIQIFMKNKKPADDLFDKIDAQALNDYLGELMEGLTAKVFRTYNASSTLQKQLNKCKLNGLTMQEKFEKYEEANRQVAILCNHQKTVGKKFMEGLKKKQNEINTLKNNLKELQKHLSHFSAKKDTINKNDLVIDCDGKIITQKFPPSKEKTASEIKKLQDKIARQQKALKKRDEGKQIALGTSKTNYNDPRISVAWCKKNEVKIEKVFTKNLLSKFLWAMYTDQQWEF